MKIQQRILGTGLHFLLVVLTGCASLTGYPKRSTNPDKELEALKPYLQPDVIGRYSTEPNAAAKQKLRDDVVNARLHAMDIHFGQFEKSLFKEGVGFGVGTDWAGLALNAAGTVTGGATAKAALAAAAGGILGARAAFDKEAFFAKTMPVVMAEMVALRKNVEVEIRKGLNKSDGEYSLYEALIDLESYYQAGTVPGAIVGLAEIAGVSSKQAAVEISKVRTKAFVEESRQKRIEKVLEGIDKLKDQAALELEKDPPVQDVEVEKVIKLRDPQSKRSADPAVARQMLKMRAVLSGQRSDAELNAWEAAVKVSQ